MSLRIKNIPTLAGIKARIPLSGQWLRILDNPNAYSTSANDNFGNSAAVSGDYAIIGAYLEDDAVGGTSAGKAYIYNVSTGALVHTISNPNVYGVSTNAYFGFAVGISGNNAIIGAYGEDDATGTVSGKVFIYDVTTGSLLRTINNPSGYSTTAGDSFGRSVAIDGNYAIIGANNEDDASGLESGKAYIYNISTGSLIHTLSNPNPYSTGTNDQFGVSVGISGNYAIVGALNEDEASGTDSGKVYIYDVTTGSLLYTLNNPNAYSTVTTDRFGQTLAISGNYAIVGVYLEDDAGGTSSGKAYIYNVTTGTLVHTLDNPNVFGTSANDSFGRSVSISGNYAVVSAQDEDETGQSGAGKVYVFNVTTGALVRTIDNPNGYSTSANDAFGSSVAISGNYIVASAVSEDDAGGLSSGKAYIFNLTVAP